MRKIDIHCHTSPRKIRGVIPESATIGHITAEMKKHEIEKTVLLATYFPHKKSGISNFRLHKWIEGKKSFFMFGSLDFEFYFYQGYNELKEMCMCNLIRGIKIYTCYQKINIQSPQFKKIVNLAKEYNLPLMFHAGYSYASRRKYGQDTIAEPYDADRLAVAAREHSDVKMIFSHMSKPFFHDMVRVAQNTENVFTDMSGLIDSAYDQAEIPICIEEIRTFVDQCGSEKLLFGTDFPVQTHEHSILFIEEAIKDEKDKENIYYNNAAKLLNQQQGWKDRMFRS